MADEKLDLVQFGKLIQSVETLTKTVETLVTKVESLDNTRSKGLGILTGIALVSGGVGSYVHSVAEKLFK